MDTTTVCKSVPEVRKRLSAILPRGWKTKTRRASFAALGYGEALKVELYDATGLDFIVNGIMTTERRNAHAAIFDALASNKLRLDDGNGKSIPVIFR